MSQYTDNTVKSTGSVSQREARKASLKNYVDSKDEDRVVYSDPMGFITPKPVDLRPDMFEDGNWQEKYEQINDKVKQGAEVRDATKAVLDTARISLPVWVTPDIVISDEAGNLPLANSLARVAVNETKLLIDEVTETGNAESFTEGGSVAENNDTIVKHEYNIVGYGRKNEVTDLAELAGARYDPTQMKISQQARAIRKYEETQAIQGTNNDANGFDGLQDLVDASRLTDESGASSANVSKVRDLITEVEIVSEGEGNMLAVTDHRSFRNLKDDLNDFQRFESPSGEISFGIKALEVDGVMVVKSHGVPTGANSIQLWVFDASVHWFGMLEDITLKPLAPGDTTEKMLSYAYGTFVSQSPERIAGYINLA